ncbi:hypothetical protein FHT85_003400 [Rhizobium sp. BK312]|jgi:hypothetical protein|uniref:hypothetical protein n=1 Tax=Rhizobium sp. BK312 TaxID=2587080 RepID=UPI0013AED934|nr:hypothetical protein [Rhizobium sp. BK312]MBB3426412.1 hypothetical protein [Rhizobium sp. BK312]
MSRESAQRFCGDDIHKINYLNANAYLKDRAVLSLTLCHIGVAEIDGADAFAEVMFSSKDGAGVVPRGFGWRMRRRKR